MIKANLYAFPVVFCFFQLCMTFIAIVYQVFIGNKTEVALLNFGKELGVEYKKVRDDLPIDQLYPFSSARKRMSVLVKSDDGFRLYSKGASEIIVSLCTDVVAGDKVVGSDLFPYFAVKGRLSNPTLNNKVPLDKSRAEELGEVIHKMAADGLRTIGLGYRTFEKAQNWEKEDEIETALTLVAIVGIRVRSTFRPESSFIFLILPIVAFNQ